MTDTHLGSRSQNRMSSFGNITQAALKASNQIKTGRKIQNVNTWNILKVVQGKLCVCDGLGKEVGKLTQALFTILWSTSCRWGESSGAIFSPSFWHHAWLRILWKKLKAVKLFWKSLIAILILDHGAQAQAWSIWTLILSVPYTLCLEIYTKEQMFGFTPFQTPGVGLTVLSLTTVSVFCLVLLYSKF